MAKVIDLKFQTIPNAIASFLMETTEGPVLIETGPHSTLNQLEKGLQALGYDLSMIKHVFITHIHFDHAGAAWWFAQKNDAIIYMHPFGEKHMSNPEKLYQSAKRIYQDAMDLLWGKLEAIPSKNIKIVTENETVKIGNKHFIAHYTPGHAVHHIAWQVDDILFAGDVAGCKIKNGIVVPPCPPPDINIEDWQQSIQLMRSLPLSKIYLTHFGFVEDIQAHLNSLENILLDWAAWMKPHFEQGNAPKDIIPLFQDYVKTQLLSAGVKEEEIGIYEAANPSWMSVAGLLRYWKKKTER